jgi:predicted nucleic acid-binding protein
MTFSEGRRPSRQETLLLDTCVLIDHLRGHEPAKAWLTEEAAKRDARFIYSVITLTELLSGLSGPSGSSGRNADGRQKEAILALLSLMDPIPVSVGIAARAADYVREWGKSRGVAVPDALIAATAEDVGAVLVTRDATHFPMTDIQVCRPY